MAHCTLARSLLALVSVFACTLAYADPAMRIEVSSRQPDGKILVAGQAMPQSAPPRVVVGRLNPEGTIDATFGGGWQTYVDNGASQVRVSAVTTAPDGKVIVGLVHNGQVALLRLDSSGSVDSSFGNASPGLAVDSQSAGLRVNALRVLSDGSIVGLGSYADASTGNVAKAALVRYDAYYGNRDPSFGPNGVRLALPTYDPDESEFLAADLWNSGFVAAGYKGSGGSRRFLLAGFDAYAYLSGSFGYGGYTTPVYGQAQSVTTQSGGIIAAGHDSHTAFGHAANNSIVVKLDGYGSLDYGFGSGGVFSQAVYVDDYWDASAAAASAFMTQGGNLVVGGTVVQAATGRSYFFNYNSPGGFYLLWGHVGPKTSGDDTMTAAYSTGGSQIVAVGTRDTVDGERALRVRYFDDTGEFDTDFPTDGADSTPNPLVFGSQSGLAASQTMDSPAVRVTGINVPVSVTISGGLYAIGCADPFTSAPGTVQNGQYICIRATSAATPSTTTTATITVGDAIASYSLTTGDVPDTIITYGPSGPSGSSVAFNFSANPAYAASTFECRLDGAAFASCGSSKQYSGLADGTHTFEVRAVNSFGTDPTPASSTWTVLYVPDTTITSSPPAGAQPPSNSRSATFAFTSNSTSATFECKLDASAFSACISPATYGGLADGSHTFQVRAVNAAGPDPSPAALTWSIDATAPVVTITSAPAAVTGSTNASIGFSANESGVSFYVSLDGAPFTFYTYNPMTYTGLTPGAHTFAVYGQDFAGNVGPTVTRSWTIDTTPPDVFITSGPSGVVSTAYGTVTFGSHDAGATFDCDNDGSLSSGCTSPWNTYAPNEGVHTFRVRARDAAGNYSGWQSISWTVDFGPPDTTITSGPSGTATTNGATFVYSSNDAGAVFQCSLDGVSFASCPATGIVYSGLAEGAHSFSVRAVDAAGNIDATPATRSWTVDTVAPITSIDTGPPTYTASRTVTFTFSSSDAGARFECNFMTGWQACTSPWSISAGPDNLYQIDVRAIDAAGNVGPSVRRQWVLDTTPDDTFIQSTPPPLTNSSSATFSFYADPMYTYQCRLDGQAFTSCTSPVTYTALSSASHTFDVRSIDQAGNIDPTPASYTWTVDTVAPVATITSAPPADSNTNSATFAFAANESAVTFTCFINTAPGTSCTSPVTYTNLPEGYNAFVVWATDAAGNRDTSAGRTWYIDLTAPETTLGSGPSGTVAQNSATFTFTSPDTSEPIAFECSLDGAPFAACTSPATYSGLADGAHAFRVRARDGAGNVDPTPASASWTVDTSAPDTSITAGPTGTVVQTSATFGFTATDATATFQCSLDGAAYATCASPATYSGLADGMHTFAVRALDAVGNVDSTPASRTWSIDTTAPNTSISSGPQSVTTQATATFAFSATEGGSTFQCKLDGGPYGACTSPVTYAALAGGAHSFSVFATDAYGNADASSATWTWTITPDTTITSGPASATNSTTATFSFTATVPSTFQCKLDGAAFAACTSPKTYTGVSSGSHTFSVRATDTAGDVDSSPASLTWVIDTTAPNTTITAGPNGNNNTQPVTFSFTSSESGSTFECAMDTGAFAPCTSPTSYSGLAKGSHTFKVRAIDAAGNVDGSPATRNFGVN